MVNTMATIPLNIQGSQSNVDVTDRRLHTAGLITGVAKTTGQRGGVY